MRKIIKSLFIAVALTLIYHTIIGLTSLIVFPSYILFLLLIALLICKDELRTVDKVLLILGICVLASLSYALVPFNVADRFPDANYIDQLIRNYKALGKVMTGIGTNQAYDYSYYPFEEVFVVILSEISGTAHTSILRLFPFFNTILLIVVWLSIYKNFLEQKEAYVALTMALTSFYLLVFFIRPLHPSFGLIFASLLFLIWTVRSTRTSSIYNINTLIDVIFITAIALSHNTTALFLSLLFILSLSLLTVLSMFPIIKYRNLVLKFSIDANIKRRVMLYYVIVMLMIYLTWNMYVAWNFFKLNIITAVIKYMYMVLSHEVIPFEILFGFGKGIKINIISFSELATQLAIMKTRIGYASLAVYLLLSGIIVLRYMLGKVPLLHNKKVKDIADLFVLLSLSSATVILFGLLTWSYTFIRDYYWRFYSYYFLFSSPITTIVLMKSKLLKHNIRSIIIFIILLNSILWMPNPSLGIDMPYELSDPRSGIQQAIALSRFIHDKYHEGYIVGTRYVFNVIGPLSEKHIVSVIYSVNDFCTFANNRKRTPIILSTIEALIVGIQYHDIIKYNILFNSYQFLMLINI